MSALESAANCANAKQERLNSTTTRVSQAGEDHAKDSRPVAPPREPGTKQVESGATPLPRAARRTIPPRATTTAESGKRGTRAPCQRAHGDDRRLHEKHHRRAGRHHNDDDGRSRSGDDEGRARATGSGRARSRRASMSWPSVRATTCSPAKRLTKDDGGGSSFNYPRCPALSLKSSPQSINILMNLTIDCKSEPWSRSMQAVDGKNPPS